MAPFIIIDDNDLNTLVGAQWERFTNSTTAHNQTTTVCNADLNGKGIKYFSNPRVTITLPATDKVALYGTGAENLSFNYTFASEYDTLRQAAASSEKSLVGKSGVELWSIENAESFQLQVLPATGLFTLDYALVTPNAKTNLATHTLMLDDHDGVVQYSDGQWTPRETVAFPRAVPMMGTLNRANGQGASFEVQFTGASIAVYGALNTVPGKLSASYSIDKGAGTTVTHFNGSQKVVNDGWITHQAFFKENVTPGTHTLTVTVTEATANQSFYFDYLTFEGIDTTQLSSTTAGAKKGGFPSGGIAGIVIGVLVLLGICGCLGGKTRVVRRYNVTVEEL